MIFRPGFFSKALNRCRSPRVRLMIRAMMAAGIVAGIYLALLVGLTLGQRSMIYYPSRLDAQSLVQRARADGFEPWHNGAGETIGWKRPAGTQIPTAKAGRVLILHGNAGCALHRVGYADLLQRVAPLDVFILEYPGYGSRPGRPAQNSIFAAATDGLQLLLREEGPVYLIGESLGTGVAAYLAGTFPQSVTGLLLIVPFNNLGDVAQHHMPIFPARLMLRDKYKSDVHLKSYSGPVGVLLARQDRVVPSRFGRRLYDGYAGPKRLWELPHAGHEDVHQAPLSWWKEALEFLKILPEPSQQPAAP